jgi:AraC-like DNA-binding protein
MKIRYFKPNAFLNKYIERYWSWESEGKGRVNLPKIIPGTGIEFLFHYQSPLIVYNDHNGYKKRLTHSHIICLRNTPYNIMKMEKLGFIAVRFRVGAFRHFFKGSMNEIGDSFLSAEEIWGKQSYKLEYSLFNAISLEERVKILDSSLLELFLNHNKNDKEIDYIVNRIYYGYKDLKINDLAKEINISKRHLERRLIASVGVRPKDVHRNSRFVAVLRYLLINQKKEYLTHAIDAGYYDQSHFLKDFNYYVGETPSLFLQEKNFMTHFYNKRNTLNIKIVLEMM